MQNTYSHQQAQATLGVQDTNLTLNAVFVGSVTAQALKQWVAKSIM